MTRHTDTRVPYLVLAVALAGCATLDATFTDHNRISPPRSPIKSPPLRVTQTPSGNPTVKPSPSPSTSTSPSPSPATSPSPSPVPKGPAVTGQT